jgi:natural product biosynthesis luciferase-like monooxygenase protein
MNDAIAVVGIAGYFPGAADVAEFWTNLLEAKESIRLPPADDAGHHYGAYGILDGIDQFDSPFFGFTPADAELLDPQHRLFLECAWTALEDAGCPPDRYGDQTGVFASASASTYLLRTLMSRFQRADPAEQHRILLACDKDFLASRVSYKLDLRGPSLAVQTACSSSLVAVHLACRSLNAGDCGIAVVGGSTIFLPQATLQEHVEGAIVSSDGHCRPFDEAASGTVGGNGVAAVVLRRLDDAIRDHNRIRAVVLGSAVDNDGRRKAGFAAPGWEGQVTAISRALERSGLTSEQIGLVEAHGTGTPIGDPLELLALAEAFSRHRDGRARPDSCAVGSVKSNIGHLDATSGLAGLIKAVLAIEDGVVPATLHFRTPNPSFDWENSPFFVNQEPFEWPQPPDRRHAGVSSFGIGGTNAHVILSGWVAEPRPSATRTCHMLTLSARSPEALAAHARDLHDCLEENPDLAPEDVAFTLHTGRSSLPHRRFVVADSRDSLVSALAQPAVADEMGVAETAPRVTFLFPGQGAQYPGMGLALRAELAVFRAEFDHCLNLLEGASQQSVRAALEGASPAELNETIAGQPALFAVEYALARTWQSLGFEPGGMVGHSIGEYVAAVIAGVMPVEDAARLVAVRARLMQALPEGRMLAVALPEQEAAGFADRGADVAAVNGSRACVLAGPPDVITSIEAELTQAAIPCRPLAVSRAFHSRMIDECLDRLREIVGQIRLSKPEIPFTSDVTGKWITDQQATSSDYWVEHARKTVRFNDCLNTVLESPPELLIEMGPGRALSGLVLRHPRRQGVPVLPSMPSAHGEEPEPRFLACALGRAWVAGAPVRWPSLWDGQGHLVPLPTYPFQRRPHWPSTPAVSPAPPEAKEAAVSAPALAGQEPGALVGAVHDSFAKALGVAVDDDVSFFDLGGDSLVAVQVVLDLRAELGCDLSLRDFVNNPTVRHLTSLLASGDASSASPGRAGPVVCAGTAAVLDPPVARVADQPRSSSEMKFSLFFFSADSVEENRYGFLLECAQLADRLGYEAIWTPERHFHHFADLYPNPSVLAAGLATITEQIKLRAGSVVAPLHHPARIAEEWAIVDNLSGGRVGLGFAPGFLPLDFVFSQASYQSKEQVTLERVDKVRRLWRGEAIEDINGLGERITLRTFPRPVQPELPVWLTASNNPKTFANAGKMGFNVLTALINLDMTELADRIAAYRAGRSERGLDPSGGTVTVMVHAFLGEGSDMQVRSVVEQPFRRYLWANSEIIRSAAKAVLNNLDLDKLTPADRETLLDFAFERYWKSSSLLGGHDTFAQRADRLRAMGVNEVACLIDFGLDLPATLASLERIAKAMWTSALLAT